MTNPSSTSSCQPQMPSQQDIIRMLAQHFNQQVYNADGPSNMSELIRSTNQSSSATSPANNIDVLHQNIAHFQQQQQLAQEQLTARTNQDPSSLRFDLNQAAACLMDSNLGNQTFLSGRLDRSQPSVANLSKRSGSPSTSIGSANKRPLEATSSIAYKCHLPQPGGPMLNPLLTDINLINALNCFKMTNDQFMLSLQQQYLLQAASAAGGHYELKHNANALTGFGASHQPMSQHQQISEFMQHQSQLLQHNQQQQSQANLRARRNQNDPFVEKASNLRAQVNEGRELLKFSISTILGGGGGTPDASNQEAIGSFLTENEPNITRSEKSTENTSTRRQSMQALERRQSSSPECDPNVQTDLSSDSSSTDTPRLQTSNSSLTLEHYQIENTGSTDLHQGGTSSLADQVARYQQAAVSVEHHRSAIAGQQQGQQHQTSINFLAGSAAFPWTAAARGKPRRGMMRRAVFSDSQRVGLEKRFQLQKYISKPDRKKLAEKLGLRDSQVKIWFQNRRMKWRNSKERELLSAGGSREQTLPTRNNPNPDLSDVGETIKKISSTTNVNNAT